MLLGQNTKQYCNKFNKDLKKRGGVFQSLLEGFATFKVSATIANFQPWVGRALVTLFQKLCIASENIVVMYSQTQSGQPLATTSWGKLFILCWLPQITPKTLPTRESECPVVLLRNSEYQLPVGNAYQGPQCLQFMRGPMHANELSSQPHEYFPGDRVPPTHDMEKIFFNLP